MKHKEMHTESKKFCHFYNNGKSCPYESIGCMFQHSKAGVCKKSICTQKLCQFEHKREAPKREEVIETVTEEVLEEEVGENDCHLCPCKFQTLEPLCEHLRTFHVEYHQGVLRNFAKMETQS